VTRFVLDASVSLAWYLDSPPARYALDVWERVREGSRPVVPPLWVFECANTLLVAERRKALQPSDSEVIVHKFEELMAGSFDVLTPPVALHELVEASRSFHLTSYDVLYLLLAIDLNLPLATLNASLAAAARRAGVPLFS